MITKLIIMGTFFENRTLQKYVMPGERSNHSFDLQREKKVKSESLKGQGGHISKAKSYIERSKNQQSKHDKFLGKEYRNKEGLPNDKFINSFSKLTKEQQVKLIDKMHSVEKNKALKAFWNEMGILLQALHEEKMDVKLFRNEINRYYWAPYHPKTLERAGKKLDFLLGSAYKGKDGLPNDAFVAGFSMLSARDQYSFLSHARKKDKNVGLKKFWDHMATMVYALGGEKMEKKALQAELKQYNWSQNYDETLEKTGKEFEFLLNRNYRDKDGLPNSKFITVFSKLSERQQYSLLDRAQKKERSQKIKRFWESMATLMVALHGETMNDKLLSSEIARFRSKE